MKTHCLRGKNIWLLKQWFIKCASLDLKWWYIHTHKVAYGDISSKWCCFTAKILRSSNEKVCKFFSSHIFSSIIIYPRYVCTCSYINWVIALLCSYIHYKIHKNKRNPKYYKIHFKNVFKFPSYFLLNYLVHPVIESHPIWRPLLQWLDVHYQSEKGETLCAEFLHGAMKFFFILLNLLKWMLLRMYFKISIHSPEAAGFRVANSGGPN